MSTVEKLKNEVATNSHQVLTVFDFMKQQRDLISKALPKQLTVDRLIGMFTIVIRSNPELLKCSQSSLIGAMVQTAQLGLMPGNISHCYYVPFNNKGGRDVQFILGYKGMIELVNRSGKSAILSSECVYENDEFEYCLGLEPILKHKPTKEKERGEIIGVYAIAKNLVANEKIFVYLTRADIDKVRKASAAGQSDFSPWNKWFEEMAKKTAIKRLSKLLPLSVDIQKQLSTDETIKTQILPDMTDAKDEAVWQDEAIETEAKEEIKETPPAQKILQEPKYTCENCTLPIEKEVYDFSIAHFKKSLCRKCQLKK